MEKAYGVFDESDQEMFWVDGKDIISFMRNRLPDAFDECMIDDDEVVFYAYVPGEVPGKVGECSLQEFFDTFEADGYFVKPIQKWEGQA
jgi:hypothetical protein